VLGLKTNPEMTCNPADAFEEYLPDFLCHEMN